jgi:hypothetical protein
MQPHLASNWSSFCLRLPSAHPKAGFYIFEDHHGRIKSQDLESESQVQVPALLLISVCFCSY